MLLFLALVSFLLAFVFSSDALFLAARRWLRGESPDDDRGLFWLTRGAGPTAISVVLYYAFLFLPGRSPAVYVTLVLGLFLLVALYGRRELPRLVGVYGEITGDAAGLARAERRSLALLGTTILVVLGIVFGVAYPIVEHDSLSAAMEARIMVRDLDMENYLRVKVPDPQTGYYMENFRTPFLQMLYVFFGLVAGMERMDLLARTVSPVFGLFCLLLLAWTLRRERSRRATAWALFLLAATPIFFYMTYNNGIDTARLYLSFAALVWISEMIRRPGDGAYRVAAAAALFAGFAVYSHLLAAPAMAGAYLVFLASRRWTLRRKAVATLLIGGVSFFAGAQIHYLGHPEIAGLLSRSLNVKPSELSLADFAQDRLATDEGTASSHGGGREEPFDDMAREPQPAPSSKPEAKPKTAAERFEDVLEIRGQGDDPISQWIFGRLQMFTGIEYFGVLFYLFWIGLFAWWRREEEKTALDAVLVGAGLLTTLIVLSGVRKLSWSNPRYIGSVLVVAAYFAGPLMVSIEENLARRLPSRRRMVTWALVAVAAFPVVLVTSIRGAKVEITNPGNFYEDFRSFVWVRHTLNDPFDAVRTFWEKYFGIRNTIRYFAADDATKLRHSHDYFAAVQYVNRALPEDARVFVLRDARYFYYGERYGVVWYSPENYARSYNRAANAEELLSHFESRGFNHVIVDDYSTRRREYTSVPLTELLEDPRYAEKVFDYGIARVYRLRYEWP